MVRGSEEGQKKASGGQNKNLQMQEGHRVARAGGYQCPPFPI